MKRSIPLAIENNAGAGQVTSLFNHFRKIVAKQARLMGLLVFFSLVLGACSPANPQPKGGDQGNSQPTGSAPVALEWSREGGIAGFCDNLLISTDGQAVLSNCQKESPVEVGRTQLDADQLALLQDKLQKLKPFDFEQSDAATADAMTVKLKFNGNGSAEASDADKQALLDLASSLATGMKQ